MRVENSLKPTGRETTQSNFAAFKKRRSGAGRLSRGVVYVLRAGRGGKSKK